MLIETEPAGLMMLRYKFYFNQQTPDPEDPWVFAYFQEHQLEARRELQEEHDGIAYKVLHFGQCYLGRHVNELAELYKRGVERSVLVQHLFEVLTQTEDASIQTVVRPLAEPARQRLATLLAAQLHATTQFETTAENHLRVSLALPDIRSAVLAMPGAAVAE